MVVALAAIALFLWLLWRAFRAFLWSVGGRLAFSYFLLGVLPIPMLALLAAVATYLLAGFFLGHLYRDTARALEADLTVLARERLAISRAAPPRRGAAKPPTPTTATAGGARGDARAPESWPAWVAARSAAGPPRALGRRRSTPFPTAPRPSPPPPSGTGAVSWRCRPATSTRASAGAATSGSRWRCRRTDLVRHPRFR